MLSLECQERHWEGMVQAYGPTGSFQREALHEACASFEPHFCHPAPGISRRLWLVAGFHLFVIGRGGGGGGQECRVFSL